MKLTTEQRRWLAGEQGASLQWAMEFNLALGEFFDAESMHRVSSAHFAPDLRMGGEACTRLLERVVDDGGRVAVPSYMDPCSVDFGRAAEMVSEYGLTESFVQSERSMLALCRRVGFVPTYTCINYQTVSPPAQAESLAWGDTGAAIMANAVFGARTNFEGGPSALASALLGYTPAYGMHLDAQRRGNLLIELDCDPVEAADWGAIAAWAGSLRPGYGTVPVFFGDFAPPGFAMLKQLGVALASHGGHAMFHLVGVTPEAPTLNAALGGAEPDEVHRMTRADLDGLLSSDEMTGRDVDLVVFAAPQLAIDEIIDIGRRLGGRKVHENTRLIIALDPQVRLQADNAGLTPELTAAGVELSTGTCFYPEAPLMREKTGWKTLVTNSAKLVNTLRPSGFECAFRRIDACIDAAVAGRLLS